MGTYKADSPSEKSVDSRIHSLDVDADRALFTGEVQGLAVTFFENERPLAGLAGLLDWRFQGVISDYLREGAITGAAGQCAYIPITRNGIIYHLILAGAGESSAPGQRTKVPAETWKVLQKNLSSLKLKKIGISRRDFGDFTDDLLSKHMKGVPLWIVH
ncbi:MAG: hypothetical protein A2428_17770 [Bdellovibrionales bacterium RIFOXYC1_FULL_54_43]|nr:MAG: hypothetical protein A2428_17770 [Bdellovibrionales bacterium RIFOXYC1_FULL_54_43]OFZ83665.1 MAG: hypothetical protein A2603_16575 [Bdellovibrionales bacterium RIFOXYD1_FULL_55_31]